MKTNSPSVRFIREMSSKLVIVIVIFCLIDLSILAIRSPLNSDDVPNRKRPNKSSSRKQKSPQIITEIPDIDFSSYHRLTNARYGPNFALDIVQNQNEYFAQLNVVNGKFSQEWNFVPLDHGAFYIQNRFLGDAYALTFILRDEQGYAIMVRKDNSVQQRWHFLSFEEGTYKMFNEYAGSQYYMDVYLDNRLILVSNAGPNDIGHNWIIDEVNPTDNY